MIVPPGYIHIEFKNLEGGALLHERDFDPKVHRRFGDRPVGPTLEEYLAAGYLPENYPPFTGRDAVERYAEIPSEALTAYRAGAPFCMQHRRLVMVPDSACLECTAAIAAMVETVTAGEREEQAIREEEARHGGSASAVPATPAESIEVPSGDPAVAPVDPGAVSSATVTLPDAAAAAVSGNQIGAYDVPVKGRRGKR
jgi:hypothetical protein